MLAAGLFSGQRFELIDGDLIDKMGQKPSHASAIQLCLAIFIKLFGVDRVRIQLPLEAGLADRERSMPEPDVAVLAELKEEFVLRHPNGREVTLAVEIADSTLKPDTTIKRDLYARAGVLEYWVLDLNGRRLLVHRSVDEGSGLYGSIQSYSEAESIDVEGGAGIQIAALLPSLIRG